MEINESVVRHVAQISRLNLTDDEIKKFTPELGEILKFFSQLGEVDTAHVAPSFQPVPLGNALRDDVIGTCVLPDEALALTMHKRDGYFKGPKAV